MSKLSLYPPTLDGIGVEQKRQEILAYFNNTYELFETMFDILKNEDVFYKKSENTRHPMIFYYGHTATFYINKFINMNIIKERINPEFESIFAIGVDEMDWDDLDENSYKWPKVSELKEYRAKVKEVVQDVINTIDIKLPITWDSDMWIVMMGIEHERIHIETSSVLHRQMPLEFIKETPKLNTCEDTHAAVENSMVYIPQNFIRLGKDRDDVYYGWDNEYGRFHEEVSAFEASKYLVSNGEFLEFVQNGGYDNSEYWCDEGKEFLKRSKAKYPPFWVKEEDGFSLRTLTKKIPLPLSWPVEVNNLESLAFCRYKSKKDNIEYTLPSESEYESMCNYVGVDSMQSEFYANHNFDMIGSVSVDINEFKSADGESLYDVVGNVWQHSRTPIRPFDGFRVHKAYDDFTTPTFDEMHALILGSSWASSGNLIMKHSRYAFRRHFYQHAGFRYVVSKSDDTASWQSFMMDDVKQNCRFQNQSRLIDDFMYLLPQYTQNKDKALDLSCGCGRLSLELSEQFKIVEGVDSSARFVQAAIYKKLDSDKKYKNVEYWQGDVKNLKSNFRDYDLIVLTNLKDKPTDVETFLNYVHKRINNDGIFALIDFENSHDTTLEKVFEFLNEQYIEGYRVSIWKKS